MADLRPLTPGFSNSNAQTQAMYDCPVCIVRRTTNQTISNNTDTVIDFEAAASIEADTHGMFDTGNPDLLTVKRAGVYLITANVVFAEGTTGYRDMYIVADSNFVARELRSNLDATVQVLNASALAVLAVGDVIEVVVRHTQGTNLNITTLGNYSPRLSAMWVRNL